MPLFSVIVPTYGRCELLSQTLGSVWSQIVSDYELIVVDDGSTDGTAEYLRSVGSRVHVISQSNKGPGAARNRGAAEAVGEYLAFLDSDDLWFPWTLASYARAVSQHGEVNLVGGRGVFFKSAAPQSFANEPTQFEHYSCLFSAMENRELSIPTPAMAFRRESFLKLGGFRELFVGEDMDLWLRAGCLPGFVWIKDPPVCAEREHAPRITRNLDKAVDGLRYMLQRERDGAYPGETKFARVRETRLAKAARSVSAACLRQRREKQGWELYQKTFPLNLRLRRWRYMAGFPLLAILKAAKTASRHFGLQRSSPYDAPFADELSSSRAATQGSDVVAARSRLKRSGSLGAFRSLMVVRDEDDIIEESLKELLKWADAIYVLDLGSTDETWNIVKEIANCERRVIPFRSAPFLFNDAVRGYVFETYRDRFRDGDWVLRVDADEIHHMPPPEFIKERLSSREGCVFTGWYYFRLTSAECAAYESGHVDVKSDRKRSITDRRRFYKIPDYSEPRMFRYRSNMKWSETASFPHNAGLIARERIPIRHYPHRDPLQMEKRYRLRSEMFRLQAIRFPHWRAADWRKDIIDYDPVTRLSNERTGPTEGLSAAEGHTAGPLYEWKQGEPLPSLAGFKHVGGWRRRFIQKLVYPALVSWLDQRRHGWPKGLEPAASVREKHPSIA